MSLRIRSCPPIHSRKQGRADPAKPRFAVRDPAGADSPSRRWGPTGILKGAIVVFALLVGTVSLWSAARGPDPHYLEARRLVSDYEFGKAKQATNYEHPVYGEALGELAQVDPGSSSVEAADALRSEIERNIEEFRRHQARLADCRDENFKKQRKRESAEFETRVYGKLIPFDHEHHPECE